MSEQSRERGVQADSYGSIRTRAFAWVTQALLMDAPPPPTGTQPFAAP